MLDPLGERVGLGKGLKARGNVEVWLGSVEAAMRANLRQCAKEAIEDFTARPRHVWAQNHCSQVL
jgi:dynein heavy chain